MTFTPLTDSCKTQQAQQISVHTRVTRTKHFSVDFGDVSDFIFFDDNNKLIAHCTACIGTREINQ